LQYVLNDTQASVLVIDDELKQIIESVKLNYAIKIHVIEREQILANNRFYKELDIDVNRMAMILYTSGTTNHPKGVVTTHANIVAQITTLIKAWEWSEKDYILCILPLNHIHGIINVVCCSLWSGACCEFLPKFEVQKVFEIIAEGRLTLFMAVPTIYYKLITYWDEIPTAEKPILQDRMERMRLMVCGSAALQVSILNSWRKISGHTLLERYGMTEIGMALSNPLKGRRFPGYVGRPLPKVQVRIADENNKSLPVGMSGEIQVKGPSVFLKYWNKEKETQESFTEDRWFKTGDIGIIENSKFKILGRNSVDIIKSGAYKISALEIEDVLINHKKIKECSVIGIPNEEWGEIVCAVIVKNDKEDDIDFKRWLRDKLPSEKIPRRFEYITELPRNNMGKVSKKELLSIFNAKVKMFNN
jgi:malonyl-CoA/methylmalonyl-CoA synthetase